MKKSLYFHSFHIPNHVKCLKENQLLRFYGPLGQTCLNLNKIDPKGLGGISIDMENNTLQLVCRSKASFGLFKKLIENKFLGVTRGFLIYLKIVGIGYRAMLSNENLLLKLGYSHDIVYKIPSSIKLFLIDPTLICIFGIDKNQITQIASKLRNLRKPSVYKGKGIRLVDEKILLKQGKKK